VERPVSELTERELLEESARILREVRGVLAELAPLIAMARAWGANGAAPSAVAAAGLRRAVKRANHATTATADRHSPG
jgi:hypothetical protein